MDHALVQHRKDKQLKRPQVVHVGGVGLFHRDRQAGFGCGEIQADKRVGEVGLRDGVSIMDVALWHICLRLSFSFVWKRTCHLKPRIPQQVKESNKSLVWTPLKGRENLGAVGMREQRR